MTCFPSKLIIKVCIVSLSFLAATEGILYFSLGSSAYGAANRELRSDVAAQAEKENGRIAKAEMLTADLSYLAQNRYYANDYRASGGTDGFINRISWEIQNCIALHNGASGWFLPSADGSRFEDALIFVMKNGSLTRVSGAEAYYSGDTLQQEIGGVPAGAPGWSAVLYSPVMGKNVVSFRKAVYSGDRLIGVAGTDIPVDSFITDMEPLSDGGGCCEIRSASGRIVCRTGESRDKISIIDEAAENILAGRDPDSGTGNAFAAHNLSAFRRLSNGWIIISAPSDTAGPYDFRSVRNLSLLCLLLPMALFFLLIVLFHGQYIKKMLRLTRMTEEFAGGNFDAEPDFKAKDEIGILYRAFRGILRQLQSARQEKKAADENLRNETVLRVSAEKTLAETAKDLYGIFKNSNAGIYYACPNGRIIECNSAFADFVGRSREEIIGKNITALSSDSKNLKYMLRKLLKNEVSHVNVAEHCARKDGSILYCEGSLSCIYDESGNPRKLLGVYIDVTSRKNAERELITSHTHYLLLFNTMFSGLAVLNIIRDTAGKPENLQFADINPAFEKIIKHGSVSVEGRDLLHVLPGLDEIWINTLLEVAATRSSASFQAYCTPVSKYLKAYLYSPNKDQVAMLVVDATVEKQKTEYLKYLNYHDKLTGLYNRAYFDKQFEKMDSNGQSAAVIIGDVNGLKLANDVFGHLEGDRLLVLIARIITSCCREGDVAARWGGDEFLILLSGSDAAAAEGICGEIYRKCSSIHPEIAGIKVAPSISLGSCARTKASEKMSDVLKRAEECMYKKKLLESNNMHSAMISSVMNSLFEKCEESKEEYEKGKVLCIKMARILNFSPHDTDDLILFSMLHDIGKITISEQILKKPGKLTEEEMMEIRRHPEAGYRIARSAVELLHIANLILTHHEWWNGGGYPQGISGTQIPLMSRIFAVVDAYGAMTGNRLYRDPMTPDEAKAELLHYSGIQFDPEIVRVFVEQIID